MLRAIGNPGTLERIAEATGLSGAMNQWIETFTTELLGAVSDDTNLADALNKAVEMSGNMIEQTQSLGTSTVDYSKAAYAKTRLTTKDEPVAFHTLNQDQQVMTLSKGLGWQLGYKKITMEDYHLFLREIAEWAASEV